MNLDQIIEYLRDGVKGPTLKPATVNSPTISHMVAGLEEFRDKYAKYKLAALKKQQP
jgi:Fe-S-cluster formation regulator IscX/YfhJ